MFGGCLEGVWRVSRVCLEGVWSVCGGGREGVLRVSVGCPNCIGCLDVSEGPIRTEQVRTGQSSSSQVRIEQLKKVKSARFKS